MFSWLSLIPVVGKLFDTVSSVTNKLTDARIAAIQAGTEVERIRWEGEVKSLEARQTVLIAALNSPYGVLVIIPQFLLGMAVVIIMWKIVVYDQALGQWTSGRTNALGKDVWDFIKIVTGFYFVSTWLTRR